MAESSGPPLICDGEFVVLRKEEVYKAVQVQKRKKVIFEKQWIYLDNAIGKPYGTTFEITTGGNLQMKKTEEASAVLQDTEREAPNPAEVTQTGTSLKAPILPPNRLFMFPPKKFVSRGTLEASSNTRSYISGANALSKPPKSKSFSVDSEREILKKKGLSSRVIDSVNECRKEHKKNLPQEPKEAGADNRNIIDDGKSQKLTRDDIEALKEKGIKGQDIVQQLIENSTTFRDKTEFAQEKYIKKKKKKYEANITVLKPSTRILAIMYYAREPGKICQLRYDTLAQMLTLGNIHAGSKVIVMETCAGLVLGSVMERMGGYGSVIQMYPGTGPVRAATDCFGFPKLFYKSLYEFPLSKVESLMSGTYSGRTGAGTELDNVQVDEESNGSSTEKQEPVGDISEDSSSAPEPESAMDTSQPECMDKSKDCSVSNSEKDHKSEKEQIAIEKKRKQVDRRKRESESAVLLQSKNADGLIIASRFHPTPLLLALLEFVAPSRPFVVYCQYKEPLLECYTKLRERGGVINAKLSETWLRNYQVLQDRSHPKLVMSSGGGYLLHGITVARENSKPSNSSAEGTEEPAPKKLKVAELDG